MHYYKNPVLCPAKGGYIVKADKCMASKDAYDGTKYVGEHKEVFVDGEAALARLDELFELQAAGMKKMKAKSKMRKMLDDDDY
jgi:hypothetical protein